MLCSEQGKISTGHGRTHGARAGFENPFFFRSRKSRGLTLSGKPSLVFPAARPNVVLHILSALARGEKMAAILTAWFVSFRRRGNLSWSWCKLGVPGLLQTRLQTKASRSGAKGNTNGKRRHEARGAPSNGAPRNTRSSRYSRSHRVPHITHHATPPSGRLPHGLMSRRRQNYRTSAPPAVGIVSTWSPPPLPVLSGVFDHRRLRTYVAAQMLFEPLPGTPVGPRLAANQELCRQPMRKA